MKKIKQRMVFAGLSLLLSNISYAENDVDVITIISVGAMYMQLNISESYSSALGSSNGDTRKHSSTPKISGTEVGVTVLDDKFYYGFTTLATGQSVSLYEVAATGFFASRNSQEVISRTSNSVYTGYLLGDNIGLYGGLTYGTGNYGDEIFIDEFGPFIGGRYSINLSSTSTINLETSISLVSTETTFNDLKLSSYTVKSTDRALSFSATWLRALDRGRSFFVKLKVIDLALSGSADYTETVGAATGSVTINGSQVITSLSLGMGF